MPRRGQCAACLHQRLPEAEEMHRAGQSARAIAATTGISRNSFLRHVQTCMAAKATVATAAPPAVVATAVEPALVDALPTGPVDHPLAGTLADRAEVYAGMLAQFRAIEPGPAAARDMAALTPSLLRAIKDQEASIMRVPAPKPEDEKLRDSPSFVRYQDIAVRVLMRFPEARAALVEALNAGLAEEGPW